jgi:CRISPR-associated protein Csh2
MSNTINQKSEILFLYESTYSIPNGDPFTGEQRYDEETKKILVSDVRIKRFIRNHLEEV